MLYLTDLIMVLLEAGTDYLIFENLYEKRTGRNKDYKWFYIGAILIIYAFNVVGIKQVNLLCCILGYIAILSIIYEVTIFQVLFWMITISCANVSIEIGTYLALKELAHISIEAPLFWTWFSISADIVKGIVACIVFFLVSRIDKEIYIHFVAKIIICIGAFMICSIVVKRFSEEENLNILNINMPIYYFNAVLVVVLMIISIYFWLQMEEERNENQKLAFEKVKNELQEQHYLNVQKVNTANSQFVHNMHHYFDTIRILASEGNTTDILLLLGEIDEIYKNRKSKNYCEEPIVNAILLDKAAKCEEEHIKFEADVELGLDFSNIKSVDLVTILGNLLENAIEANMKCSEGKRWIRIRVFKPEIAEYIIFEVNNYFDSIVVKKGKSYLTTKKEKQNHGIGLKSIEAIVKQYKGMMKITTQEHTFMIQVMLGELL